MLGDVGCDVRETGVGGDEEQEKYAQYYWLPVGLFLSLCAHWELLIRRKFEDCKLQFYQKLNRFTKILVSGMFFVICEENIEKVSEIYQSIKIQQKGYIIKIEIINTLKINLLNQLWLFIINSFPCYVYYYS